jgi:hypothetical protein
MVRIPERRLPSVTYERVRAEVLRAAVELSEDQLLDLTDALHGVIRLRRPGRPVRNPDGWVDDEIRSFAG